MWYLNKDILFMIFEELNNDNKKFLHSCLLVNRTWCVTAIPILWRNPVHTLTIYSIEKLFNVILLHLSEELKNTLKKQGINNQLIEKYQGPLFNYINFWKYLNLNLFEEVILLKYDKNSNLRIIKNEMLRLFINGNNKFNKLSISYNIDYQIHLIPGAEYCFSELESFQCCADIDQNILKGMFSICKSIKEITFENIYSGIDGSGIIKLIEVQKNLKNISFIAINDRLNNTYINDENFCKSLEKSLIKHTDTVKFLRISWMPVTRILSCLVNLISLDIDYSLSNMIYWSKFENGMLPYLKILKVNRVPSNFLENLIKNTTRNISEIRIRFNGNDSKRFFQIIYQNCPNLRYLTLSLIDNFNSFIPELENLLINCQLLNGLTIDVKNIFSVVYWDKLFIILAKSSPINLFDFKFYSEHMFKSKDLELFFNNWENRKPIFLEMKIWIGDKKEKIEGLLKKYKEKGIIKKYLVERTII
ncbi:hypothetical protein RclHR1_00010051 [Rhizophagus clarus]|uniref:F-box domain-containing protein n=1 Tax=Rhizophagus clarus TaxID=94130 RepID=A0A2Z6QBV3_9GLOM|nr:hypothetical protein RclHR1_00010051 [Rhizophagus clarus]GES75151.1 hypothetical protein GLOIN_2v1787971 [Rhizophagus clarus]